MGNRSKTLALMTVSAVTAGTIGAVLAPSDERKFAHAALWGGLSATTTGVLGLFIFDEESKRRESEAKALKLEKDLAAINSEMAPELIATNRLGLTKPLPDKFKNLITPGEWSLYRVDRWASSGENELVHQDLIFRFHQPQLNPMGKPTVNEGGK
ncbi:hypothetical protein WDW86_10150 [Bdellovibrionota bacterium FG-2]